MTGAVELAFGPYRFDSERRRLSKEGAAVVLGSRAFDVLAELLSRPGDVFTKEALVTAAWRDVAVTDNSLEQAVSQVRSVLGTTHDGSPYVETLPRRGYRFVAPVTRVPRRDTDEELEARLAPHRAFLEGRAALETLSTDVLAQAQEAFLRAVELAPEHAPAHVGLANASVCRFESTRADDQPDMRALEVAVRHAREACRLDPDWAETWATLGFVLHRTGSTDAALASSARAVALDPDSWRHQIRTAFVAWGEARLRAATRARQLLPGLALAHWLAATVHVARQAFEMANRELEAGAAAQDAEDPTTQRFGAVGLHWLHGLVRLHLGDGAGADAAFERELAREHDGHLYARECCANVWYARGALRLGEGDQRAALAAFDEAVARVDAHAPARAARAALSGRADAGIADACQRLRARGSVGEAVLAAAIPLVLAGAHERAAALVREAVGTAPPGNAGWIVPVEPLLGVARAPTAWAPVLALLRARAS